ncbi:MAG: T9SS type A sorting domain-containing protein, partial [Nitrososphaeraceae archaeon]
PNHIPSAFSLNQNYPNPFNPSTQITFTLDRAGLTTLSIYNVLGEKVATLISSELPAGIHQFSFDAARLSTGVYFYSLFINNNLINSKK